MASDAKRPKRPRDPNQLGKLIVDLSVGETEEAPPADEGKTPAAQALGRLGGGARAEGLSAVQARGQIAICKAALASEGPLSTPELAVRVMKAKALDEADRVLRKTVTLRLVHALAKQCQRGQIAD